MPRTRRTAARAGERNPFESFEKGSSCDVDQSPRVDLRTPEVPESITKCMSSVLPPSSFLALRLAIPACTGRRRSAPDYSGGYGGGGGGGVRQDAGDSSPRLGGPLELAARSENAADSVGGGSRAGRP